MERRLNFCKKPVCRTASRFRFQSSLWQPKSGCRQARACGDHSEGGRTTLPSSTSTWNGIANDERSAGRSLSRELLAGHRHVRHTKMLIFDAHLDLSMNALDWN